MKKKKSGSFFGGLLAFVLILVVVCTVAVNLIFTGDRPPKIGNYYLYLQSSDDMSPDIPSESLVVAESAVTGELQPGNKVLCYLADGSRAARMIYRIEETADGTVNYYPGKMTEQDAESPIKRTNIFAVCIWANPVLYQYVNFATSVTGLMALLVAPCVILIIMLLVKIYRSGEEIEEDEFELEENEPEEQLRTELPKKKTPKSVSPLYDPNQMTASQELEEKKSSISENFAEKPVNENSPYQKAVQEHEKTTRFRREEIEAEALRALEEPAPRKKKSPTQVFPTQEIRQQSQMQHTAAPSHFTQEIPVQNASIPVQSAPVPIIPVQNAPMQSVPVPPQEIPVSSVQEVPAPPVQEIPVTVPETPKAPEPPKPAPKPAYKSTSPNIDDILKSSERRSKSEISSSDSIDDLIRVLENQKKKL